MMDQIKMAKLEQKDLKVIRSALEYYLQLLQLLIQSEGTAQQNIHCSILVQFGYQVAQKLNKRNQPETSSLKLEVFTAFVLKDALMYYHAGNGSSDYEKAIARRLFTKVGSLLPVHSDMDIYSVKSKI